MKTLNKYIGFLVLLFPIFLQAQTQYAVVTGRTVNLRTGAGTSFLVAGQVSQGQKFQVVAIENGWVKINWQQEGIRLQRSINNPFVYLSQSFVHLENISPLPIISERASNPPNEPPITKVPPKLPANTTTVSIDKAMNPQTRKLKFGIHGGIVLTAGNKMEDIGYGGSVKFVSKPGFKVGLHTNYPLNPKFSVGIEANYSMQKSTFQITSPQSSSPVTNFSLSSIEGLLVSSYKVKAPLAIEAGIVETSLRRVQAGEEQASIPLNSATYQSLLVGTSFNLSPKLQLRFRSVLGLTKKKSLSHNFQVAFNF